MAAEQDRQRADRSLADTEYLAREVASLRQALGETATLGTLDPGKFADIVAVRGDPTAQIALTRTPSFVMKQGRVYLAPD